MLGKSDKFGLELEEDGDLGVLPLMVRLFNSSSTNSGGILYRVAGKSERSRIGNTLLLLWEEVTLVLTDTRRA